MTILTLYRYRDGGNERLTTWPGHARSRYASGELAGAGVVERISLVRLLDVSAGLYGRAHDYFLSNDGRLFVYGRCCAGMDGAKGWYEETDESTVRLYTVLADARDARAAEAADREKGRKEAMARCWAGIMP